MANKRRSNKKKAQQGTQPLEEQPSAEVVVKWILEGILEKIIGTEDEEDEETDDAERKEIKNPKIEVKAWERSRERAQLTQKKAFSRTFPKSQKNGTPLFFPITDTWNIAQRKSKSLDVGSVEVTNIYHSFVESIEDMKKEDRRRSYTYY